MVGLRKRALLPEVLVKENSFAIIRARQTYDALLSQDHIPAWLA